jgi:hypothetical protein
MHYLNSSYFVIKLFFNKITKPSETIAVLFRNLFY